MQGRDDDLALVSPLMCHGRVGDRRRRVGWRAADKPSAKHERGYQGQVIIASCPAALTYAHVVVSDDTYPAWSPDGAQIAFMRQANGATDLFVMEADGSDQPRLANDPDAQDPGLVWSPDATQLAFLRNGDAGVDIYVVNLASQDVKRLTTNPTNAKGVTWRRQAEDCPAPAAFGTPCAGYGAQREPAGRRCATRTPTTTAWHEHDGHVLSTASSRPNSRRRRRAGVGWRAGARHIPGG